jgi:hypothetical protein
MRKELKSLRKENVKLRRERDAARATVETLEEVLRTAKSHQVLVLFL